MARTAATPGSTEIPADKYPLLDKLSSYLPLSPAEIFGVSDRLGALAVGKDADVFVATGDIMDTRTQVTHVFVDGAPQSLETRHTRLYREFKDRP